MRRPSAILSLAACLAAFHASAAEPDVRVILSSDVRTGVYGRVEFGNAPPPPVVYAEPVWAAPPPRRVAAAPQPIYLHVPPGHAKHWDKHCQRYHACDRPVYFVKSEEYEPKHGKGKGKGKGKEKHDHD